MKFDLYFRLRLGAMADDRVMALIEALGMEGWGIYLALLWELRQHPHYRCSFASLPVLAHRWKVPLETLLSIINDFRLFHFYEQDGELQMFSSEYLDEEMAYLSSNRVSTVSLRREPSVAVTTVEKRPSPPTVKRAANGRFTATPGTIKNKKRKEEEKVEEPVTPAAMLLPSWEQRVDDAFGEQSWVEVQAMHSGMGRQFIEQLAQVVAFFKRHVVIYGKESTILSVADAKSYFGNFIRRGTPMQKELQALLNKQAARQHECDSYRYEQRNPKTGERSYCGRSIPAEAPPRPNENAVWNEALGEWA